MMKDNQFKNVLAMWITAIALGFLALDAGAAVYSGGTGTETDPNQIGSAVDWTTLSVTQEDWDKHFVMISDIDLGGASVETVGHQGKAFTGKFDGAGHVLRNVQINRPANSHVGIFGSVGVAGEIINLGVEEVAVWGNWGVGSLVGMNYGTCISCYATGSVMGGNNVGGLVGYNSEGVITSCYAATTVNGINEVGGLVGYSNGPVTSCYARGPVTGGDRLGGLVGQNSAEITLCYSTGRVMGTSNLGGLVGKNGSVPVTSSYWDANTSWLSSSDGGEGRTTDEMTHPYAANSYVGWDFATFWVADTSYKVNDGYPYLLSLAPVEDNTCGCGKTSSKDLTPKELLKRVLGDWLLVGLSVLALAAFSITRK